MIAGQKAAFDLYRYSGQYSAVQELVLLVLKGTGNQQYVCGEKQGTYLTSSV